MYANTDNRKRAHRVVIWADDEELAMLKERMSQSGVTNMGAYLRKMGIAGVHVNIDLTEVRELVTLLRRCSNNINQIAKRTNETRNIYAGDVADLRERYNSLWDAANKVLLSLGQLV
jgi:uncharacterized protein YijF (DUF1287 family)